MNPQPPLLADAVTLWRNNELFWIIKNGVKMTGMPAFGLTHSDDELWDIVGFVRQLPHISGNEYQRLRETLSSPEQEYHYHSSDILFCPTSEKFLRRHDLRYCRAETDRNSGSCLGDRAGSERQKWGRQILACDMPASGRMRPRS